MSEAWRIPQITDAPRESREPQQRIDDGELSWEDITAGRHLDDPNVRAGQSGTGEFHPTAITEQNRSGMLGSSRASAEAAPVWDFDDGWSA